MHDVAPTAPKIAFNNNVSVRAKIVFGGRSSALIVTDRDEETKTRLGMREVLSGDNLHRTAVLRNGWLGNRGDEAMDEIPLDERWLAFSRS